MEGVEAEGGGEERKMRMRVLSSLAAVLGLVGVCGRGGGVGVYYFFTKNISVLGGPVWFNDRELNGGQKWTIQWDINF